MFNIQKMSLKFQLIFVLTGLIFILFSIIGIITYTQFQKTSLLAVEKELNTQVQFVFASLDYTQETLKNRAELRLEEFSKPFKDIIVSNKIVKTGNTDLPELLINGKTVNNDTELLTNFKKNKDDSEAAILLFNNNSLYRINTLLKDKDGNLRNGSIVDEKDVYPSYLKDGKTYVGTIERNGKDYILLASPIKNNDGKVIGGITVRVNIEESLTGLKNSLKKITIGKTGYVYVVQKPTGDVKDGFFILHPAFAGKKVSQLENPKAKEILIELLEKSNGKMLYDWADKDGKPHKKMVVFKEHPELHWVIATGSFVYEFTEEFDNLAYFIFSLLFVSGLILISIVYFSVNKMIKPIKKLQSNVENIGQGIISEPIYFNENSINELDITNKSLEESRKNLFNLIEAIKITLPTVKPRPSGRGYKVAKLEHSRKFDINKQS